jgi:hypothetical protein
MQAQNVEEYKAIREELARVRNCVTSYVGFVILGAGPAFGFLAGKTADKTSNLAMGFASVLLAILSTLVLFLLSYKFTSHNRYAGYSKLLTHERFNPNAELDHDIFFWEICIDKLRATDCDRDRWESHLRYCEKNRNSIPNVPGLDKVIKRYSGPAPTKDKRAWLKGWPLLFSGSRENTGSWKLPLYIARIFGTINLAFVVFAVIFFLRSFRYGDGDFRSEHLALVSLFPVFILLWMAFISKLYRQMLGSETVEAFCRKFVPIRLRLLRELNEAVGYNLIGTMLLPEDKPDGEDEDPDPPPMAARAGK